jgi:hypothetical protein
MLGMHAVEHSQSVDCIQAVEGTQFVEVAAWVMAAECSMLASLSYGNTVLPMNPLGAVGTWANS